MAAPSPSSPSVGGILLGLGLMGSAVGALYIVENLAVKKRLAVDEVSAALARSAAAAVDPASAPNNTMVYVSGNITVPPDSLGKDPKLAVCENQEQAGPVTNLRAIEGLAVIRVVEMCQLVPVMSTTAYGFVHRVVKRWEARPISTAGSLVPCPPNPECPLGLGRRVFLARGVTLAGLTLSGDMAEGFAALAQREVGEAQGEALLSSQDVRGRLLTRTGKYYVPVYRAVMPLASTGGKKEPEPEVGDVRVRVYTVSPTPLAVIGEVWNGSLRPRRTATGVDIGLVAPASTLPDAMLRSVPIVTTPLWVVRGGATLVAMAGAAVLFGFNRAAAVGCAATGTLSALVWLRARPARTLALWCTGGAVWVQLLWPSVLGL